MKNSVTRKAILIGCPGDFDSFLPGVSKDLENMNNYLLSDKGGRWFPDEIITLKNPSYEKLLKIVHSVKDDYCLIYFSGHGFTKKNGHRMLVLRDKSVQDLFFINDSPKQMIFADACRNFIPTGISGVPNLGDQWYNFDGTYESRDMFDDFIRNSPDGKIIVHATQTGEFSYDSPSGGYFTRSLLDLTTSVESKVHEPLFIDDLIEQLPDLLEERNNSQVPEIAYSEGDLQVPFGLAVPQLIKPKPKLKRVRKPQPQPALIDSNSNGLLMLLGLLLVVAIVSE